MLNNDDLWGERYAGVYGYLWIWCDAHDSRKVQPVATFVRPSKAIINILLWLAPMLDRLGYDMTLGNAFQPEPWAVRVWRRRRLS